jgi:hypothetical protein
MKQLKMLVGTLCILSALLVTDSWSGQPVHAAELAAPACRLAAVHGSYEFVAPATVNVGQGTVIAIPDHLLYASPAAYASKGTLIFDGTGKIILNAAETFAGPLASPVRTYGDYAMNGDCTATVTFADGIQLGLKLVGNDKMQTLVSTTPGFVLLRPAQQ